MYIFLQILQISVDFAKLNTRKLFFQTTFAKMNTRQICTKFIFRENKYTKRYALKMLVNSVFFRINQKQEFIHRHLSVFPFTLTETSAECPLIQLTFSYSFFFGAKMVRFLSVAHSLWTVMISSHDFFIFGLSVEGYQ